MARTITDLINVVKFAVDDPDQTRYSDEEYIAATNESVDAILRKAEIVNRDFPQYLLGENKEVYEATIEEKETSLVVSPADSGTAVAIDGGSNNKLYDSTKNWILNEWKNYTLSIVGGTGSGQDVVVVSNTPSTITITGTWTIEPDDTSLYEILPPITMIRKDPTGAVPWPKDVWRGGYVKITLGTAVGQEFKIDSMGGFELKVEGDGWTTQPADGDTFAITAAQKDFALPDDFDRVQEVKVDGETIYNKRPSAKLDNYKQPAVSFVGSYMRIEGLSGGETIEVYYTPILTPLAAVDEDVPFGDAFFSVHRYYVTQLLKGWNYESIMDSVAFRAIFETAMAHTFTDMNLDDDYEQRNDYEEFDL